jgi:hypothetical protein
MNTLLSDAEDETTDIKDNFTWDNFTWDIDTDNDDSNNVSFSLSDIESVYVTDNNTLAITLTDTAATSLESTTDFDALTDNDSVSITEGFSADTTGNVSTTDSLERDTSIVVFDFVNGESSNHSDRTFDVNVSYTIYIMVNSTDQTLTSLEQWVGGHDLGSDDRIILVGSSSAVIGRGGNSVSTYYAGTYSTSTSVAVIISSSGEVQRGYIGFGPSTKFAWTGAASNWDDFNNDYLTTMPTGILTSQGLA